MYPRDSAGEAPQAAINGHPVQPSQEIDARFPEQFVDSLSRREVFNKHLFRPNTYLHKWWARRCGATFRTILKQFAPSAVKRDYYAAGGLEGLTVLDPMMGGGTTLHEAIRMGANVVGADIDPIPVLQARASLSRIALPALRRAFDRFSADLHADLRPYFQTHCPECGDETDIRYCLYGVRKRCQCGTVIQVEQYDLRQDERGTTRFDPRSGKIRSDSEPIDAESGVGRLIKKGDKNCPSCNQAYAELDDVPFYARYALVAVVGECGQHGLFYRTPSQHDLRVVAKANRARSKLDFGALEDFLVRDGPKSGDLLRHNVRSYLDVFSSRQLLYLHSAITHLQRHEELERLNLAMLVSTSLEFNSMLCGYKGWHKNRPGAIRHTFGLHAYSFQYTALEKQPRQPGQILGQPAAPFQRPHRTRTQVGRASDRAQSRRRRQAKPGFHSRRDGHRRGGVRAIRSGAGRRQLFGDATGFSLPSSPRRLGGHRGNRPAVLRQRPVRGLGDVLPRMARPPASERRPMALRPQPSSRRAEHIDRREQLHARPNRRLRRVSARAETRHRPDGVHVPPLEPQSVERTHDGVAGRRLRADERIRGVLGTSHFRAYPKSQVDSARLHSRLGEQSRCRAPLGGAR